MATFVSTVKFTAEGMKDVAATCQRAEEFRSAASKMGVEVKEILWTLGPFDGLLILEAPDDESVTAALLHLGSQGYVHTSSTPAYRSDQMQSILGRLS